jgi:hypothetical protein
MSRLIEATAGVLGISPEALQRALGATPIPLRRQPGGLLGPDMLAVRRILADRAKPLLKTGCTP